MCGEGLKYLGNEGCYWFLVENISRIKIFCVPSGFYL